MTQEKVYVSKKEFHLRRTVKLDVVADSFIYDLVYRNRNVFRKSFNKTKYSYGYRFSQGLPVSAIEEYKYFSKFDIASFFNSIYHHVIQILVNC